MSRWSRVAALSALLLFFVTPASKAQISVQIGPAPVCPYGYYDFAPYACAPYGYYGPEWFHGGVFIGAGPWFHGPARFYGHVDNRFHPDRYHGRFPEHGEAPRPGWNGRVQHFHGNEVRDGRGHVGRH